MNKFFTALTVLSVIFLALPLSSRAEGPRIEIQDTLGVTRNVTDVETAGDIQFKLVDKSSLPANGVEVTLTNAATGETLSAISANGIVTFPGVAPGVWTVASAAPSVTFTSVSVTSASMVAGAFGGTAIMGTSVPVAAGVGVAGAAAIAGGTIAIVDATSDDNNDDELSPFS